MSSPFDSQHSRLVSEYTGTRWQHFFSFAKLCRWSAPIGIELLGWPCMWGLLLAWHPNFHATFDYPEGVLDDASIFLFIILFWIGAIFMRTAGCLVNDLVDKDIDRQVLRTQSRPLATNEVASWVAYVMIGFCTLIGAWIAWQLPMQAQIICFSAFILLIIYPRMKYIMPVPQVILGLAFNIGVLVAFSTFQPLVYSEVWVLYSVGILWTIAYDTVYGFQDLENDIRLGLYSTSILCRSFPKIAINSIYVVMLSLLAYLIWPLSTIQMIIFLGLCSYIAFSLGRWEPALPSSSARFFKDNRWVGMTVALVIAVELLPMCLGFK